MNVDKASLYQGLKRRATVLAVTLNALLFTLLLVSGGSHRLRDVATSLAGAHPAAAVAIYVGLLTLLQAAALAPLVYYDGYLLEHRFGLSSESRTEFARDHLKAVLLSTGLAIAGGEVVYAAMWLWPRAWWIVSASALTLGLAVLASLAPVVLMPLFYRFRPLERRELQTRLAALSDRAGVRILGVYEWGLGAKTRRANAALVGSGRTRRVLVSDTLLADYSDDEIEVILAHELGHHAHRDMFTGLIVEALLIVASLGFAALALQAWWQPLALAGPSDIAGLPLLVLAGGGLMICATPAVNLVSRYHERRADRYALTLTERPAAFVSAMRRLGAQNLAETNPSRLAVWLFHSHPPVDQRISAARAFERG